MQSAPFKIILPVLLSVLLFVVTLFGYILPRVEGLLMDRKREMIHALTDSAVSTLHYYAEMTEKQLLPLKESQARALQHLRSLRYGVDGKDYFWVNDMTPTVLMHPYRSDLEGQDVRDFQDPSGKRIFVACVETVRARGSGFVDYQWQWQDNPQLIVPKISYVQGFAPWGWVIGTGVYVEDVRLQIATITNRMFVICLFIFSLLMVLSGYVIWQGVSVEHRRRQTAQFLKESEEKYRLLAETASEIILIFDEHLRVFYANRACLVLFGVTEEQMCATSLVERVVLEQQPIFTEKIAGFRGGAQNSPLLETEFVVFDHRTVHVEATFARLPDSAGRHHFLMTGRDITEKKLAEAKARQQQEQLVQTDKLVSLGTLVSGVAHEINNPISSLMLNIEVFEKFWQQAKPVLDRHYEENGEFEIGSMGYLQLRERFPRLLSYSREGIARVKKIVGDLKDFAGQTPSDTLEDVDINSVVGKSIDLVHSLIKNATDHLRVELSPDLPIVHGNRQRLEQVVINLLVNGCQATDSKDKPLVVSTGYDREKRDVYIEVRDAGVGITPADISRVTDPFFTTKRNSGGTGLGLSISDTIVRDHGGRLEFNSSPTHGTVATVWLPLTDKKTAEKESA